MGLKSTPDRGLPNAANRITMAAADGRARFLMKVLPGLIGVILIWTCAVIGAESESWIFDRLDRIGGHPTTILGNPRVVDTAMGKAIEFDGVEAALVVDVHPLAGAAAFTWEAIFRPDGGEEAQRWF